MQRRNKQKPGGLSPGHSIGPGTYEAQQCVVLGDRQLDHERRRRSPQHAI
jgi:hypothetical protein